MARKRFKGLNELGRVDWDMRCNLLCAYYADNGLHARTIGDVLGLSVGQVHYRCQLMGRRLRDYRDGVTKSARVVIGDTKIRTDTGKDGLRKYVTLKKK